MIGTCDLCGGRCGMSPAFEREHPTEDRLIRACSGCWQPIVRWLHGAQPGTCAVGPPDERIMCGQCGLPIARRNADAILGPGRQDPVHAGCKPE